MWAVQSQVHCRALATIVQAFPLRAKKARDFVIWEQALAEKERMRAAGRMWRRDWTRMAELYDALQAERKFRHDSAVAA